MRRPEDFPTLLATPSADDELHALETLGTVRVDRELEVIKGLPAFAWSVSVQVVG